MKKPSTKSHVGESHAEQERGREGVESQKHSRLTKARSSSPQGFFRRLIPRRHTQKPGQDSTTDRSISSISFRPHHHPHVEEKDRQRHSYAGTFLDRDIQKVKTIASMSPSFCRNNLHDSGIVPGRKFDNLCSTLPSLEKSQTIHVKEIRHSKTKELVLTKSETSKHVIATIVINGEYKEMKLIDNSQSNNNNNNDDLLAKVVQLQGGGTRYKIYGTKPMFTGQVHYGTEQLYPWAEVKNHHHSKDDDSHMKLQLKFHRFKGKEITYSARDIHRNDKNSKISGFQIQDDDKNVVAMIKYVENSNGTQDRSVDVKKFIDPCVVILFMAIAELFLES